MDFFENIRKGNSGRIIKENFVGIPSEISRRISENIAGRFSERISGKFIFFGGIAS